MAFKDYLIEDAALQFFHLPLLEAVNGHLAKTLAALQARGDDDNGSAGIDFKRLSDIVTTLRIIGSKELRGGITKDDVGFDPNNVDDIYDALSRVPDSPKASMPSDVGKFFKEVASLSNKMKKEELINLNNLLDKDPKVRQAALQKLKVLSTKVDQMYNKLKATAKK